MYSLVLADTQWCAINKAYTRAFSQQDFLINKASGMTTSLSNSTIRLYETYFRKQMTQMLTYFFKIDMLKAAITRVVKKNHY